MKNIKLYPCFKHWLKYDSIWIISDTHFDDEDCKYMDLNWITPEEHIQILKKELNKQTVLIHLGDVGNPFYLDEIKSYKVLISGNHDRIGEMKNHFDEIYTGPLFIADRLLLSHEPLIGMEDFCCNIHGHDHEGTFRHNHINLASNVYHFRLFNLGASIKGGLLSQIENYHRRTIEKATTKKKDKEANLIFSSSKDIELIVSDTALINDPCKSCPNHPSNGGSGVCNCTFGAPVITY